MSLNKLRIHADFIGGNIHVERIDGDTIYVERDMRDSGDDWFYFAFCVEGAAGKTLTFKLHDNRVGYYGPAVSHDLNEWHFLGTHDGESFTYTFGENENKVYFAHHILYPIARFYKLMSRHNITVKTLCRSRADRNVPYIEFGEGDKCIVLTARHHACESTGSYVLEGVLDELLTHPMEGYRFFVVPFVDFDGVLDGDQGKGRLPYDHNRDYDVGLVPIYPETAAIRTFGEANEVVFAADFHSPWHKANANDHVFIPQKSIVKLPQLIRFGNILEESITDDALQYHEANDYPPNKHWNKVGAPCFGTFFLNRPGNDIAFTLETTYFGLEDNVFAPDKALALGRCFVNAMKKYLKK